MSEEEPVSDYKPRLKAEKQGTVEELGYITEKEFRDLDDKNKWNLVRQASKIIRDYRIQADKNCEMCESHLQIDYNDLNIDLLFEDWRECSNHCGECDKETQIAMCQLQFNIMNHLAQGLFESGKKINNITEMIMRSDKEGSEVLKSLKEEIEKAKESRNKTDDMFL